MKIINLTQHTATPEQVEAGVKDLAPETLKEVKALLTFEELPTKEEIASRAKKLAGIAVLTGYKATMIGGAPYLMAPLEAALKKEYIRPLYAFSKRESVETTGPDGSVVKTNVFKHVGFVEA